MSEPNTLLREAIGLLRDRANHIVIPEARGRTNQGFPADLVIRTNIAIAAGLDVGEHHGAPCVVKDRAAFDAAKQTGERMASGAWDGIGHYLTSITDIERHLLPANVEYEVKRSRGYLHEDFGPTTHPEYDMMLGHAMVDWQRPSVRAVSPARALLLATLLYIADQRGVDVREA